MAQTIIIKENRLLTGFITKLTQSGLTIQSANNKNIDPIFCIYHALSTSRYLLAILTSVFYLAGPPHSAFLVKVMVVIAMLAATFLIQSFYNHMEIKAQLQERYDPIRIEQSQPPNHYQKNKPTMLLTLIGTEIAGIALVAIPTGGLHSPFIWCALIPILNSAFYLPAFCSWLSMGIFLTSMLILHKFLPAASAKTGTFSSISVVMIFCLCTTLAQIFSVLFKELARAYGQMETAHGESQSALMHISSLYQALEACWNGEDQGQIAEVLAEYTARLCQGPAACFIAGDHVTRSHNGSQWRISSHKPQLVDASRWQRQMVRLWNYSKPKLAMVCPCDWNPDYDLLCQPLYSQSQCLGILTCLIPRLPDNKSDEKMKSLPFLANLGGITLDRLQADNLYTQLLISEEQNRIASEIHDGVSQYLFSLGCSLHNLSKQQLNLQDVTVQQQLKLLESLVNRASSELRSSIYGLSPLEKELQRIIKKYGDWIAAGQGAFPAVTAEKTIIMNTFEDLIKVADELGQPVLYQNSGNRIHQFCVISDKMVYWYTIPCPAESKESPNISTAV